MNNEIVIGIDGGGTYTRVVVADLKGNILGYSKKKGGVHPGKNENPEINLKMAITDALKMENQSKSTIKHIVAGFAGVNNPKDHEWARAYLSNSGINTAATFVNDATVAQYGAYLTGAGILAIAGTGSIVIGKTENGLMVRNYDFHHDSEAGARYLSYSLLYDIISRSLGSEDKPLLEDVLAYWGVEDIGRLRIIASNGFSKNRIEALQKLSYMATIVTSHAEKGNKFAIKACKRAAESLVNGIQIVSSSYSSNLVPLCFVGGVANHSFIKKMIKEHLQEIQSIKSFVYYSPQLSPVFGAVLYAYNEIGIEINNNLTNKLLSMNKQINIY